MKQNEYPVWICQECAHSYTTKGSSDHISTYHFDICDLCNHWKTVTSTRHFTLPERIKSNFDRKKILRELNKVFREFISVGDVCCAAYIKDRIRKMNDLM